MSISFQNGNESQNWIQVDSWFKSYIELGFRMGKISDSQSSKLSRLLLSVPSKEFVSMGISMGLSFYKNRVRKNANKELSREMLSQIPKGTHVRILLQTGFLDVILKNFDGSKLYCSMNDEPHTYKYSPQNRYIELPFGHPQGSHLPSKLNSGITDLNSVDVLWSTQSSPSALIFGDSKEIEAEQNVGIMWGKIAESIPGLVGTNIGSMARLSHLSRNNTSHFINSYCDVVELPFEVQSDVGIASNFDWIVLNGNYPTSQIIGNENIAEIRTISIVENKLPRRQGMANSAFLEKTNNLKEIDPELHLAWHSLPGVFLWGWEK